MNFTLKVKANKSIPDGIDKADLIAAIQPLIKVKIDSASDSKFDAFFVNFRTEEYANEALRTLDGKEIFLKSCGMFVMMVTKKANHENSGGRQNFYP